MLTRPKAFLCNLSSKTEKIGRSLGHASMRIDGIQFFMEDPWFQFYMHACIDYCWLDCSIENFQKSKLGSLGHASMRIDGIQFFMEDPWFQFYMHACMDCCRLDCSIENFQKSKIGLWAADAGTER
jgi:uncharacterized glyoxalase superfamily protein PhnB